MMSVVNNEQRIAVCDYFKAQLLRDALAENNIPCRFVDQNEIITSDILPMVELFVPTSEYDKAVDIAKPLLEDKGSSSSVSEEDVKPFVPTSEYDKAVDITEDKGSLSSGSAEEVENHFDKMQVEENWTWLDTEEGTIWLDSEDGYQWMQTEKGYQWLQTEKGQVWLNKYEGERDYSFYWIRWMSTDIGKTWVNGPTFGFWLTGKNGQNWLKTEDGVKWKETESGIKWNLLQNEKEKLRKFIDTEEGKEWLSSEKSEDWMIKNDIYLPLVFPNEPNLSPEWKLAINAKWISSKQGKDFMEKQWWKTWENSIEKRVMDSYVNHYLKKRKKKLYLEKISWKKIVFSMIVGVLLGFWIIPNIKYGILAALGLGLVGVLIYFIGHGVNKEISQLFSPSYIFFMNVCLCFIVGIFAGAILWKLFDGTGNIVGWLVTGGVSCIIGALMLAGNSYRLVGSYAKLKEIEIINKF